MTWDVCTREEQVRPSHAAERKEWSDAAYEGNWVKIFEICASESYDMSRFANVTRLLPRSVMFDPTRSPSGYTVLHQAAYMRAPDDVVQALIALGCFRQLRTLDGKAQRPCDVAADRGFNHVAELLQPPPDLLPHISVGDMAKIQAHFVDVVIEESRGMFKPDEMRAVDLNVLREVKKIWMPVPGMYGGFTLRFEGDHLITESWCRVVEGSGMRNHITVNGTTLMASGF